MSLLVPRTFSVRDIPDEPGCLCALMGIKPGETVHAFGNVPAAMVGTKWPDVYTWAVLYWQDGIAWAAVLKTERPAPWSLESVQHHFARHPGSWRRFAGKPITQ